MNFSEHGESGGRLGCDRRERILRIRSVISGLFVSSGQVLFHDATLRRKDFELSFNNDKQTRVEELVAAE